ncbi:MAG: hypothetical protein AAGF27_01120 [Pseudomonadota bacterium]
MTSDQTPKIWWAEPSSAYVKHFDIKPYFSDVDLQTERVDDMASMSRYLRSYDPIPREFVPDELRWYQRPVTEKDKNLPDAFQGYAGTPVISEAMFELLSEFDLGSSRCFELPLFELKTSGRAGRTQADRSKKDPRRWFLLHVTETKSSIRPEQCEYIRENPRSPGHYNVFSSDATTIAIDCETAVEGPPVWRDPSMYRVYFFADAVKRAMAAKGLRTPAFKFKPCLLV